MDGDPLVPGDHLHHRRFADNRQRRCRQLRRHFRDHRRRAEAADFLVIAERQMHRLRALLEQRHGGQRQRDKPLHVAGPAPVQQTVLFGHQPGVGLPVLPVDRNDIAVAGQDDPACDIGADGGVEIRLGAIIIDDAGRLDAVLTKIIFNPGDQLQIAVPRGGVKGDQRGENIAGGGDERIGHQAMNFTNFTVLRERKWMGPKSAKIGGFWREDFALVMGDDYHNMRDVGQGILQ